MPSGRRARNRLRASVRSTPQLLPARHLGTIEIFMTEAVKLPYAGFDRSVSDLEQINGN